MGSDPYFLPIFLAFRFRCGRHTGCRLKTETVMPVAGLLHQVRHRHNNDFGFQHLVDKGVGESMEAALPIRKLNGVPSLRMLFNQLANIQGFVFEGDCQFRVNRLVVGGCGPQFDSSQGEEA